MEILNEYFDKYGVITTKEAHNIGIKRHTLSALVKEGKIERIRNGVYKRTNEITDDYSFISLNSDKVVISFNSALFLWNLSDRVPGVMHISVPQGYNVSHIANRVDNFKVHYVKKSNFEIGITDIKTPLGNYVKVYDMERCICDIIVNKNNIDRQIFVDAIKRYFKSENKNVRKLIKYSRIFGVEESVRIYMEVL